MSVTVPTTHAPVAVACRSASRSRMISVTACDRLGKPQRATKASSSSTSEGSMERLKRVLFRSVFILGPLGVDEKVGGGEERVGRAKHADAAEAGGVAGRDHVGH